MVMATIRRSPRLLRAIRIDMQLHRILLLSSRIQLQLPQPLILTTGVVTVPQERSRLDLTPTLTPKRILLLLRILTVEELILTPDRIATGEKILTLEETQIRMLDPHIP